MTRNELLAHLRRLGACDEAVEWAGGTQGDADKLWTTCPRGDWLLWLAARAGVPRQQVVLAACACAREALPLVPPGEDRARLAIEAAERWARGGATLNEVRDAYAAACAARAATASADAAARAATASADAAAYAAYAAYAASAAASAATAAATAAACRTRSLSRSAEIVRDQIPWSVVEAALEGEK